MLPKNLTLLYCHGFLSTPKSYKGQLLREYFEPKGVRVLAPDLNLAPDDVAQVLLQTASSVHNAPLVVVGSSLGGFYAAWLSQQLGSPCVLVNPAVQPWTIMQKFLGTQTIADGSRTLEVTESMAQSLRQYDCPELAHPERILLLLSTADEVLDWRLATTQWSKSPTILVNGSDHMMKDFDEYFGVVEQFITRCFTSQN